MKKVKEFISSIISVKDIVTGIVLMLIPAAYSLIISFIKNIDFIQAFKDTWHILNYPIGAIWLLIIILLIGIGFRFYCRTHLITKTEIKSILGKYVDVQKFQMFEELYWIRTLPSHPWHRIKTDPDFHIHHYKYDIWYQITIKESPDTYILENSFVGLKNEIEKQGYLSYDDYNEIIDLLDKIDSQYIHSQKMAFLDFINNIPKQ